VDLDDWAGAVSRYAGRLHAWAGQGHLVVSPLGAGWWLRCAAPWSVTSRPGCGLADVLGADPLSAAAFAARLLADPHPLQAGLIGGQGKEHPHGSRTTEQVAALIRGDMRLTEAQKAAPLAVYDSMLRE
jgi:hypothetical protein